MNFRKIIFWGHLITGLLVGAVVLIMSITGAMMAFEPQILDFVERKERWVNPESGEFSKTSLNQIIEIAGDVDPDRQPESITLRSEPNASVMVGFGRNIPSLYVHPHTGEILGKESKTHRFLHDVEDWHRRLGAGNAGKAITGAACMGMFLLVLSGIWIWWPRDWKKVSSVIFFKEGLRGKARDWNWHNVIGFWCVPILLMTTMTGLIMSYAWANRLLFRIVGENPPERRESPRGGGDWGKREKVHVDLDLMMNQTSKLLGKWESITFRLPQQSGRPLNVQIVESSWIGVPRRSQMSLDSRSGEVVKWEPYSSQSLGSRLRIWVRYLHTGGIGGMLGQLLVFCGTAGAVMLVWTGVFLSYRRFFSKKEMEGAGQHN